MTILWIFRRSTVVQFSELFLAYIFRHEFWILKSKFRDLNSRLGGCEIHASEIYFSIFLESNEDWSDPQSNSTIQPKARGLLHMEHEYFAHHIWSRFRGLEHLTALEQPQVLGGLLDASEGRLRSNQKDVLITWSTRRCLAKYSMLAGLNYEELGGLSDPGQRDFL